MSFKIQLVAVMCLFLASGGAVAQTMVEQAKQEVEAAIHLEPDLEAGKKSFMVCAVCHSPEGWGTEDGAYPQIAGQLSSVIIKQLADIRARNRDNPTMYPFTSPQLLGGVQEIANVAAYISNLPMNPRNGVGPGHDLVLGEQLYKENCVDCHGDKGQGDQEDHTPAILGQHYHYLIRQFEWIKIGKRRNSDEKMVKQIQGFSARDMSAVLDYVSRLHPGPDRVAEPGWRNPDFPNYSRSQMPAPRKW